MKTVLPFQQLRLWAQVQRFYNFFEAQPIKGACFYYLRNIMHDWPDHNKCVEILAQLIAALGPQS